MQREGNSDKLMMKLNPNESSALLTECVKLPSTWLPSTSHWMLAAGLELPVAHSKDSTSPALASVGPSTVTLSGATVNEMISVLTTLSLIRAVHTIYPVPKENWAGSRTYKLPAKCKSKPCTLDVTL